MTRKKPESRKVRIFIGRLVGFLALVTIVVGTYLYIDQQDMQLNPAAKDIAQLESKTNSKIEENVALIDVELKALANQKGDLDKEEEKRMRFLIDVKDDLLEARKNIRESDKSIREIRINVDQLIEKYESNSDDFAYRP